MHRIIPTVCGTLLLGTLILAPVAAEAPDHEGDPMPFLEPTPEQIARLRSLPQDRPVVMVNLLKFRPEGGRESYARYAGTSTRLVYDLGGSYIYHGIGLATMIGGEEWAAIVLVEYPSLGAFFAMVASPEYRAAAPLRQEALLDSRLYAVETSPAEDTPGWRLAFPAADQ